MGYASASFDPAMIALNSDAASSALAEANVASAAAAGVSDAASNAESVASVAHAKASAASVAAAGVASQASDASSAAAAAVTKAAAASTAAAAASSRIAESSATWESQLEDYRIASAITLSIGDYQQLLIHDEYLIEGSGELNISGTGKAVIIGG